MSTTCLKETIEIPSNGQCFLAGFSFLIVVSFLLLLFCFGGVCLFVYLRFFIYFFRIFGWLIFWGLFVDLKNYFGGSWIFFLGF